MALSTVPAHAWYMLLFSSALIAASWAMTGRIASVFTAGLAALLLLPTDALLSETGGRAAGTVSTVVFIVALLSLALHVVTLAASLSSERKSVPPL